MSIRLPWQKLVRILMIADLILQLGCRGWIEKPIVPDTGIAIPERGILRVTKTDGAVIILRDSFITDDSIAGFPSGEPRLRTAIARTNVATIEVRGDTTPRGVRVAGQAYAWVLLGGAVAFAIVGTLIFTTH
jgi:hypothetical protein